MRLFHLASVATLCFGAGMQAARAADMPVTVDNFTRAETDLYFNNALKDAGGTTGKFGHHREPMSIDHQTVVRPNRDTLYSVRPYRP